MRKFLLSAGILFIAALAFAVPSKADSVQFQLVATGAPFAGLDVTFSLPQTFTPAFLNATLGPTAFANDVSGTLFGGASIPGLFGTIVLGNSSSFGTDYWNFGSGVDGIAGGTTACSSTSSCNHFDLYAPGLITVNPDGTISILGGSSTPTVFAFKDGLNDGGTFTLTVTPPPATVGTPEPATLALLGVGGLSLLGLRRRKAA